MKTTFLMMFILFSAYISYAGETEEYFQKYATRMQSSIEEAEKKLATIGESRSQIQAMKKRELEKYIADEKVELAGLQNSLKKGIPEDIIKANREPVDNDIKKLSRNTAKWSTVVSIIREKYDEGHNALVHSGCLAVKTNGLQVAGGASSFFERSSIAFCQQGLQSGMSPVKGINCETCAGTFTLGSTQYLAGDGGKILRVMTTADDGMVYDMTTSRIRASWPQSGFYIVYSIDTLYKIKVVELQSYITESLIRSYASPKEQENFNVNTLFRKVDQLFQQSDLSLFDFSRQVFQADWLENNLKALRNEK